MIQFNEHIFQMGWNHQLVMLMAHLFDASSRQWGSRRHQDLSSAVANLRVRVDGQSLGGLDDMSSIPLMLPATGTSSRGMLPKFIHNSGEIFLMFTCEHCKKYI